ncbi:MAG: D-glycero-beta-D-manno-heptose 1,7-bisphosphate 7-phosphatase [Gammaproteobacteria bacterium]|nr:D-glycero-beta-D-manno-heptose 1,7-bisphosphate 7-phosphatase [Gammaproteobacteria bacterium]
MKKKYKLIILDRDGVVNEDSDAYIKSPDEWHAIPGSLEAIAKLNNANILVVIASNQSGVARGYFTEETLAEIHQKMQRELAALSGHIDDIFYCPHHPNDHCACRKPETGMIKDILKKYDVAPENTLLIGDAIKDIQAAQRSGCDAALVKTGKGKNTLLICNSDCPDVPVYDDLAAAIAYILQD